MSLVLSATDLRGTRLETALIFLVIAPSPVASFTLLFSATLPLSAAFGFLAVAALARGFSALTAGSVTVVVVVALPASAPTSLTAFGLRGARGFLAGAAPATESESGAEFALSLR